jgi:hypothetical protein
MRLKPGTTLPKPNQDAFFAGLSFEEIALQLDVSTVR